MASDRPTVAEVLAQPKWRPRTAEAEPMSRKEADQRRDALNLTGKFSQQRRELREVATISGLWDWLADAPAAIREAVNAGPTDAFVGLPDGTLDRLSAEEWALIGHARALPDAMTSVDAAFKSAARYRQAHGHIPGAKP